MDSERIDWISEYGVERNRRAGFLERIRASFLRRQKRKVRDVNDLDPSDLVETYNSVFGIDSSDPTAAMRYDLRSRQPKSTIVTEIEFNTAESEAEGAVTEEVRMPETVTVEPVLKEPAVTVPEVTDQDMPEPLVRIEAVQIPNMILTGAGEVAEMPVNNYDSDAPITVKNEPPADRDAGFFPGVKEKYEEHEEAVTEEAPAPAAETGPLSDSEIAEQVKEFEDVRAEELSGYVDEQIDHELRQTLITDPKFDAVDAPVSAEPALPRQDKLNVEYEVSAEASESQVTEDVPAETDVPRTGVSEGMPMLSRPLETPVLPLPEKPLSIDAPETFAMLAAPESAPAEEHAEESTSAPEPAVGPAVDFGRAREINAANVSSGRYGETVADSFESQIAETESSDLPAELKAIQISQIIGGMILATQRSAFAAEDAVPEIAQEASEDVAEETVTAEPESFFDLGIAYGLNIANVEHGRYDETVAAGFGSQISEVESSDSPVEVKAVQVSQIIGGMILAAQRSAFAAAYEAPAETVEEEAAAEGPITVEPESPVDFGYARSMNAANAEAGRYDETVAAGFESQIAEAESSEVSAEIKAVQMSQIIGGMVLAAQRSAFADAYEAPAAEPEAVIDFGIAYGLNIANVEHGRYDEKTASVFESQISEVEASDVPADVKAVQISQIIGGMIIATQMHVDREISVDVPETAETEPEPETVCEEIPAAEPAAEHEAVIDFGRARGMNVANAASGRYDERTASVFESQIAEVEASEASADIRAVQLSQVIGGMIIATQIRVDRSVPAEMDVEIPEIEADKVEYTEPEVPDFIAEAPVAEEVCEAAPAEEEPEVPMEFRFRQMSQIVGETMLSIQKTEEDVPEQTETVPDTVRDAIAMQIGFGG
ncbi:MAG: hypothetical protein II855_04640, partial [Candidatus Methanomethylophilaceae archaeon]|nr:hypothetical protein [Candidatus Methanomethylophilaceae archaeon]